MEELMTDIRPATKEEEEYVANAAHFIFEEVNKLLRLVPRGIVTRAAMLVYADLVAVGMANDPKSDPDKQLDIEKDMFEAHYWKRHQRRKDDLAKMLGKR